MYPLPFLIACRALPQAAPLFTTKVCAMDYEALLNKYMSHIYDIESYNYIDFGITNFTKEEKEELKKIEEAVHKDHNITYSQKYKP